MDDASKKIILERARGQQCELILGSASVCNPDFATKLASAYFDGIFRALTTMHGKKAAFELIARMTDQCGDDLMNVTEFKCSVSPSNKENQP